MTDAGLLDAAEMDAIDGETATLIDAAVATGRSGPRPGEADLATDVYISY